MSRFLFLTLVVRDKPLQSSIEDAKQLHAELTELLGVPGYVAKPSVLGPDRLVPMPGEESKVEW